MGGFHQKTSVDKSKSNGQSSLIEIKNLKKSLHGGGRRVSILNGVTLKVPEGQFLTVTGPSGSGKTTLLSLIAGLDSATSGTIKISGQDITLLDENQLALFRGKSFGFIFQNFHLIPTLTALENVVLARELGGGSDAVEKASILLSQVGLYDRLYHYPSQMSGGEQQRLSLARAFVNEPKLVLADEPTGNLDSKNTDIIMKLISDLHQTNGATIIMVTHEPKLAKLAQRTIVMEDGVIVRDSL
tara:strand:+ start:537 stop:1265 length:729 start_codon:yes stop_codon:yes gene_type:complete